jgi:hypothetical protein
MMSSMLSTSSLHPEDGGSMELRKLVSYHNITRSHNREDFDLKHRRESLKTRIMYDEHYDWLRTYMHARTHTHTHNFTIIHVLVCRETNYFLSCCDTKRLFSKFIKENCFQISAMH